MYARTLLLMLAALLSAPALLPVQEASASGPIFARGAQRQAIKSQHIFNRPNRPGHFYGNTVRRRHTRHR